MTNAPIIDSVAVVTPASTTSSEAEAREADLLTAKIGFAIVAAVIALMAVVGIIAGSAALLIASGILGTIGTMTGIYTIVNLML